MIVLFYSVLCVVATLHVTRSVDAVQAPVLDWVRRRTLDAETYEEVRPHDVVPADPEGERDYYAGYQAGRDVAEQRKVVDIWRDVARRGERRPSGCCVVWSFWIFFVFSESFLILVDSLRRYAESCDYCYGWCVLCPTGMLSELFRIGVACVAAKKGCSEHSEFQTLIQLQDTVSGLKGKCA